MSEKDYRRASDRCFVCDNSLTNQIFFRNGKAFCGSACYRVYYLQDVVCAKLHDVKLSIEKLQLIVLSRKK